MSDPLARFRTHADARATAGLLATTLTGKFEADTGFFPAVFEQGNRARILPAVEGQIGRAHV